MAIEHSVHGQGVCRRCRDAALAVNGNQKISLVSITTLSSSRCRTCHWKVAMNGSVCFL